jgi:predicted dehydrogenase
LKALRAAIIGLADIAVAPVDPAPHPVLGIRAPYNHAAAYAQVPATEIVAVCDIAPAMLERFKAQFGRRWPEAKAYSDYRAMLASEKLDMVSICTPDHLHADMVVAACEAGVKGIICEKPLATTIRDAARMIAAVERHGVKMSVEHTRRWIYEYHEARETVRKGRIGKLHRIVATLNGERAMLFRNGTHAIDLVCFFAESDPEWVVGALDAEFDGYGPRYAGDGGRSPASDPGALGIISFANGVRAIYQGSQGTLGYLEIDVIGDKGRIHLGASTHKFEVYLRGPDNPLDIVHKDLPRQHTTHNALHAVVEEMVGLIANGGESVSPPREAMRSVQIMLGLLQSHTLGSGRVRLPTRDV